MHPEHDGVQEILASLFNQTNLMIISNKKKETDSYVVHFLRLEMAQGSITKLHMANTQCLAVDMCTTSPVQNADDEQIQMTATMELGPKHNRDCPPSTSNLSLVDT